METLGGRQEWGWVGQLPWNTRAGRLEWPAGTFKDEGSHPRDETELGLWVTRLQMALFTLSAMWAEADRRRRKVACEGKWWGGSDRHLPARMWVSASPLAGHLDSFPSSSKSQCPHLSNWADSRTYFMGLMWEANVISEIFLLTCLDWGRLQGTETRESETTVKGTPCMYLHKCIFIYVYILYTLTHTVCYMIHPPR